MRILIRLVIALGVLIVGFTLAVAASGPEGELRTSVNGALRDMVMGDGGDSLGVLVHRGPGPDIVTVHERPAETLVPPYSSWLGVSSGFLTMSVYAYARTLDDLLAHLLDVSSDQMECDPSLGAITVDVHVQRFVGLLPSVSDTERVEQLEDVLVEALCETYGLSLEVGTRAVDVPVLRPGPDFASRSTIYPVAHGPDRVRRGHDRFEVIGAEASTILFNLSRYVPVRFVEDMPEGTSYDFRIDWDPDVEGDLVRALEEQAGLLLRDEPRELPFYIVHGTAVSLLP